MGCCRGSQHGSDLPGTLLEGAIIPRRLSGMPAKPLGSPRNHRDRTGSPLPGRPQLQVGMRSGEEERYLRRHRELPLTAEQRVHLLEVGRANHTERGIAPQSCRSWRLLARRMTSDVTRTYGRTGRCARWLAALLGGWAQNAATHAACPPILHIRPRRPSPGRVR
jgi:hypothetical protein